MSNSSDSNGIGFIGMLQILFIGLKLTNYINWSWIWVLSPALTVVTIWIIIFILYLIYS